MNIHTGILDTISWVQNMNIPPGSGQQEGPIPASMNYPTHWSGQQQMVRKRVLNFTSSTLNDVPFYWYGLTARHVGICAQRGTINRC